MRLVTCRLADRPDLGRTGWRSLDGAWPAFMHLAPTGVLYYGTPAFAEHMLLGVTNTDPDAIVARAATVPFRLPRRSDGSPFELPDDGWDEVVRWAAADLLTGGQPDMVASLEVVVRHDVRHRGWGAQMITAMKDNARRLGFSTLVSPVRPVGKHREPHTPISDYASRFRADGMPVDPWLRAHTRVGGRLVRVAPASTVIALALDAWRRATGLGFDATGPVVVPGALVPVYANVRHDHGVYVEPAVWMRHEL
jgi:GNAT superfamily N-acetyltransferase